MTSTFQIRTQRIVNNRKKLASKCLAILKTSVGRIKRQGCGCSIDGVGAVYKNGKLRDAIAILLSPSEIYNHTYGEISEDDQKRSEKGIDDAIATCNSKVDEIFKQKEKEILTI